MEYAVLAFYDFVVIEDPIREASEHKKFLQELRGKGRIYISHDGINAQLSLPRAHVQAYLDYIKEDSPFLGEDVKIDPYPEHAFEKLTVKYRKQLVAVDTDVDLNNRGTSISPSEWKILFDRGDKPTIVIDVRNDYESKVGHFEGAICPQLRYFRDFPQFAKELSSSYDPKNTRVLMYCTGGIRCEYFSPLMKKAGFDEIYQLHGGIIKYLQQEKAHWKGRLFVFDDRVVVHEEKDASTPIAKCSLCDTACDVYCNCANMECNALFLACPDCMRKLQGCCSEECLSKGKVRPIALDANPKPFRKLRAEA